MSVPPRTRAHGASLGDGIGQGRKCTPCTDLLWTGGPAWVCSRRASARRHEVARGASRNCLDYSPSTLSHAVRMVWADDLDPRLAVDQLRAGAAARAHPTRTHAGAACVRVRTGPHLHLVAGARLAPADIDHVGAAGLGTRDRPGGIGAADARHETRTGRAYSRNAFAQIAFGSRVRRPAPRGHAGDALAPETSRAWHVAPSHAGTVNA